MKKWIWLAALALLLLPQRGTEVGKLLPVETLLIEKQAGQYWVSADTGSAGRGDSLERLWMRCGRKRRESCFWIRQTMCF